MVNYDELVEATFRATPTPATYHPTQAVPAMHKRNIYWLRAENDPTSRNATTRLLVQQRTDGATVQTKDQMLFTVLGETQYLPEDLNRDSVPLWTFNPGFWSRFTAVGGTVRVRVLYAEETP